MDDNLQADADPFSDFLCFSVYSTGLAFNRLYKTLLDRLGLTYLQYLALVALAKRGEQTVGELGGSLFLESSTLTPLIKRMEAAGLVTRRRDERDERVVRVSLTEAGRDRAREAECVPPQVIEAAGLDLEDLERLNAALQVLRSSLRDH